MTPNGKNDEKKGVAAQVLSIKIVRRYVQILKELGEGFQALLGRKPLARKIAVLTKPEVLESMSILTTGQQKFVALSNFVSKVPEWKGLFAGLGEYAKEVMKVSPSGNDGEGREQVIRFAGALSESKLLEKLGVNLGGKQETKEGG